MAKTESQQTKGSRSAKQERRSRSSRRLVAKAGGQPMPSMFTLGPGSVTIKKHGALMEGYGLEVPRSGKARRKGEFIVTIFGKSEKKRWEALWGFDHLDYDVRLEAIHRGYPATLVRETAEHLNIEKGLICKIIGLSPTTLNRKIGKNDSLSVDASERLDRLYAITATAARVLGSDRNAAHWMREPNPALGNKAPFEMVGTGIEGDQVNAVLHSIEYGGVV